jgi:hypothetical protein
MRPRRNDEEVMPRRFRLSRKKGAKKPAGAVVIARPSKWGNPYKIGTLTRRRETRRLATP